MNNEHMSNKKMIPQNEKFYRIKTETQNTFDNFRGLRNQSEANNRHAQIAQERMGATLLAEKEELKKIAIETNDALLLSKIETEEKEIEKELVELEIEWQEKQAYDLHVDASPEKTKIQNDILWIKKGDLLLAITDYVGALREEQRLLSDLGTEEDADRARYINKQIEAMEVEFREIEGLGE